MTGKQRTYIAIDLKSFFASVECVERGLDPLTANLLVADATRTEKTICLAVSPALKSYGIPGRARLFEALQKIRQVNNVRLYKAPHYHFTGKSTSDLELKSNPSLEVDFITAVPRMALYIKYSTMIYEIYLKYIASEDIFAYSIDEVIMDATSYLDTYKMTAYELASKIIHDVLRQTGITATAGIGTNMYLCKIAMDIMAKHIPADSDGVRIAGLDEMSYRKELWSHRPLTDFWRVGRGIARKLETYGIYTMGQIARYSLTNEELFYKLFGVNAELLIDHAWGWEPCTMKDVKAYKPQTNSISSGQVLQCPYDYKKTLVVVKEIADSMSFDLLDKHLVTDQLVLDIGYDIENLTSPEIMEKYSGEIVTDYYGRQVPKHAHGTVNLKIATSSSRIITEAVAGLYQKIANPNLLTRRLNLSANHVVDEKQVQQDSSPVQLDLFNDSMEAQNERKQERKKIAKERRVQEALLGIKKKYGKNAVLKGLNYDEGATAKERNKQIGGHKA